jgi:Ca2+-binding RTX toxin-like protein
MRRLACLSLLALLALAATALADSKMSVRGGVLYFINEDAGIANRLTVETDARGRMHFTDDADPYGMNFPTPPCSPGKINSAGNPVEVFCTKDGSYKSVSIQVGPGEDGVAYKVDDIPVTLAGEVGADVLTAAGAADALNGGQGNDALDGGGGDDTLRGDDGDDKIGGGAGNDTLNGGAGADTLDGDEGDDTFQVSDGYADAVNCGAGADTVVADQLDTLKDCEQPTVQQVQPVPGQTGPADTTAPGLQVGGSTSQHAGKTVTVLVTASEPSLVDASGFLSAAGINTRLKPGSAKVTVGGGGAALKLGLSKRARRFVRRDLRRHRHPKVRLTVTAVDDAGNTSPARHITIALRR